MNKLWNTEVVLLGFGETVYDCVSLGHGAYHLSTIPCVLSSRARAVRRIFEDMPQLVAGMQQ